MNPRVRRPKAPPPPLEKVVQQEIRRALERLGFEVCDLSQPRATMLPAGLPDLYARHERWKMRLWLEVKRPGVGKASAAQKAWHERERAAGGTVLVVESVRDVVLGLFACGAPIRDPR